MTITTNTTTMKLTNHKQRSSRKSKAPVAIELDRMLNRLTTAELLSRREHAAFLSATQMVKSIDTELLIRHAALKAEIDLIDEHLPAPPVLP